MCTAISFETKDHYFGRNLDLDISYNEMVTITPRNFHFRFRKAQDMMSHYALIGMAAVIDHYPLYYDATNEKGLSMAGLNFPGNARFHVEDPDKDNIAPFEFIPWILGQCETVEEAKMLLSKLNLADIPFSEQLPIAPLHWMISDQQQSIVVESVKEGMKVYDNPAGVLANNPEFGYHLFNLNQYLSVTASAPDNRFSKQLDLQPYSLGMGGIGLPGDLSSTSRFVRATFAKFNSASGTSEADSVGQFFHILNSVAQPKGLNALEDGKFEYTLYSSCCNMDKGIYYYTTYDNSQITAVDLHAEDLDSAQLVSYPLISSQQFRFVN